MSPDLQSLLTYLTIAVAAGWLLRRWLRRRAATDHGATCDRCEPARRRPAAATRGRGVRSASLRVLR